MRTAYHAALDDTRMAVLRLGALTVDAVRSSYRALERRDASLAARVVAGYDQIDSMRRSIEAACIELLWKQQPVAGELRAVAGMLQIATDIERAGYYAVDIAKVAITLDDLPSRPASRELGQLAEASLGMLDDAVRAYREETPKVADQVLARADEIDVLYRSGIQALESAMAADTTVIPAATKLLFTLGNLERVGDRAQNIAWKVKEVYEP
jgi:phosphate transport system protein